MVFLGLSVIVVLLLWAYPKSIAGKLAPDEPDSAEERKWSALELYGCGFVLLGSFFLFRGVSDGIYWVMYLVALSRDNVGIIQHSYEQTFSIIVTVIEIFASVAIILGAEGITRFIFKLRYGGLD